MVPVLVLLAAFGAGCADYKADMNATTTIYEVRVTTHAADVAGCRLIERVDSRDPDKGCGLTVQPTPEECLRYQVRRAGGDTLLMRGPVGDAYDCSGRTTRPPRRPFDRVHDRRRQRRPRHRHLRLHLPRPLLLRRHRHPRPRRCQRSLHRRQPRPSLGPHPKSG